MDNKDKKNLVQKVLVYIKIGMGIFGIGVVLLLLVHLLSPLVDSQISADGMLDYIINGIAAMTTNFLGVVAVMQTEKANESAEKTNELSQKLAEVELNRYKLEMRPFVMVMGCKAYILDRQTIEKAEKHYIQIGSADRESAIGLALQLTNVTKSFVTVEYKDGIIEKNMTKLLHICVNQSVHKIGIAHKKTSEIILFASPDFMRGLQNKWITVTLYLENRFSKRYQESFRILINSLTDQVEHAEGEWYCATVTQNYTIGRLDDEKNLIPEEL